MIIRHSRKFTAAGFLQSLLSSVVSGLASLNQIAGDFKDMNHPGMARQSLHQRFDIRSTAFLMAVPCDLMQQRHSTAAKPPDIPQLSPLAEEGSGRLARSPAAAFTPALPSRPLKSATASGCRIA